MTNAEFDRYASRTRLQVRALRIARAVLVGGMSVAEAARQEGVTHQTARIPVARILREYRLELGCPRDWTTLTVTVPPDTADEIREMEKKEQKQAGLRV